MKINLLERTPVLGSIIFGHYTDYLRHQLSAAPVSPIYTESPEFAVYK